MPRPNPRPAPAEVAVTIPPDIPDWQGSYRTPALIAVGTPTTFASNTGTGAMPTSRAGLVITVATGAGGSLTLTSTPSNTTLSNLGANAGIRRGVIDFATLPPTDTGLSWAVTNGYLSVGTVDDFVFAVSPNSQSGGVVAEQGAGEASGTGSPWMVALSDPHIFASQWSGQTDSAHSLPVVPPNDLAIGKQGQQVAAASLSVVPASDQAPLAWQAPTATAFFENVLTSLQTVHLIAAVGGKTIRIFGVSFEMTAAGAGSFAKLQDTAAVVLDEFLYQNNAYRWKDHHGVPLVNGRGLDLVNGLNASSPYLSVTVDYSQV